MIKMTLVFKINVTDNSSWKDWAISPLLTLLLQKIMFFSLLLKYILFFLDQVFGQIGHNIDLESPFVSTVSVLYTFF